ncbi:zinc ribbon domain-containing protein [Micromonospora sp. NPDC051141]|uniref:zinc ribbon domain-containing protein n=1 Tax=Micromonospora sp. NPDC051141 TaxID=3364284 RepID=UPI00378B8659
MRVWLAAERVPTKPSRSLRVRGAATWTPAIGTDITRVYCTEFYDGLPGRSLQGALRGIGVHVIQGREAPCSLVGDSGCSWNDKTSWVWSDTIAHPPLVTVNDFELVQTIMAASGRGRTGTRQRKTRRPHILRGLMLCGLCGRKMQSHQAHETAYYRCRHPNEYALDAGPGSIAPEITAANKIIAACDAKLAQYRAVADAGGDPATVAGWMAEVNAQRAAALAQRDTATSAQAQTPRRLTEDDIRRLVGSFDDLRTTLRDARSEDKSTVYRELRLALTYNPGENKISVEAKPDADYCGITVRVRGGNRTPARIICAPPRVRMLIDYGTTRVGSSRHSYYRV